MAKLQSDDERARAAAVEALATVQRARRLLGASPAHARIPVMDPPFGRFGGVTLDAASIWDAASNPWDTRVTLDAASNWGSELPWDNHMNRPKRRVVVWDPPR